MAEKTKFHCEILIVSKYIKIDAKIVDKNKNYVNNPH